MLFYYFSNGYIIFLKKYVKEGKDLRSHLYPTPKSACCLYAYKFHLQNTDLVPLLLDIPRTGL